jgi:hypothetical protein
MPILPMAGVDSELPLQGCLERVTEHLGGRQSSLSRNAIGRAANDTVLSAHLRDAITHHRLRAEERVNEAQLFAEQGSSSIQVLDAKGWRVGDQSVLASTDTSDATASRSAR